jgi:hypothetical protein
MNFWQQSALYLFHHLQAVLGGIGLTGSGIGLVKFLRHMPSPNKSSLWWGAIFDTLQDLVSNDRIGERRDDAGNVIPAPKPETPAKEQV